MVVKCYKFIEKIILPNLGFSKNIESKNPNPILLIAYISKTRNTTKKSIFISKFQKKQKQKTSIITHNV